MLKGRLMAICAPASTRCTRRPTRSGRRGRADRLQARGIPQTGGKVKEKLGKDAIGFSKSEEIFIIFQGKQWQKPCKCWREMGEVESVKTSAKSSLQKLAFCQSWYLDKRGNFWYDCDEKKKNRNKDISPQSRPGRPCRRRQRDGWRTSGTNGGGSCRRCPVVKNLIFQFFILFFSCRKHLDVKILLKGTVRQQFSFICSILSLLEVW